MSHEEALARANSYSETARKLEELSQQLSRDASYAETHGLSLSQNLSQVSSVVQFSAKVGFENSLVGGPFISFCRG